MNSFASSSKVYRLFAASIIARFPLALLGIAVLIQARQLTGSLSQAGVVAAAYAVAVGVGGPLLGRLADRHGHTPVLLVSAGIAAVLLIAFGLLPTHAPLVVLLALAAGVGLATPPIGACLRTQLPALLSKPEAIGRAYALEASVLELTYIAGPPFAVYLAVLWSGGATLVLAGVVLLAATAVFAAQSVATTPRPAPTGHAPRPRPRPGALRTPAMRTLLIVLAGVGMLLGAAEVGVLTAAAAAGTNIGAAPLFAVWGAGSFLGGLVAARCGGGPRTARGLALLLGALTVGHLALIPAAGSILTLGVVLVLAGAVIAPTESAVSAMVEATAPDGTMTEAFAWLATVMAVGSAAGAAGAGILADRAGPAAAFALAAGGGALAALTCLFRSPMIGGPRGRRHHRPAGGTAWDPYTATDLVWT